MTSVRAFVGHSFSQEDENVVRCITDYLSTLKDSLPDFVWVHATEPRADDVQDKVLELMEDKNLFIGICTKNERVSKAKNFTSTILSKALKIEEHDLEWKTSDWIIQEIGLAIGKGMKLIILLEDGVRIPGGLFGNLERISFSREKPEQAFQNLTRMINSVSQDGGVKLTPTDERSVSSGQLDKKTDDQTENWKQVKPNDNWDEEEYHFQHFISLLHKNKKRAMEISEAYLKSVDGASTSAGAAWLAQCMLDKIKYGEAGSLESIIEIAKTHESNPKILKIAAKASIHFKDDDEAKKYLIKASEYEDNPVEKVDILGDLAALEDAKNMHSRIKEICALAKNNKTETKALSKLRKLDKFFENVIYQQAMLEREIQINPSDTDKRFKLAYLYSQNNNDALALYHYLQIPENQRNAITWNNLGVSFRHFSMTEKSTSSYIKSVEKGETLAMSNLAKVYMDAGFLKEAKDLITKAQTADNCHDNVASSQVTLNQITNEEDEKLEKTLANIPERSQYFSKFGHELCQITLEKIAENWCCNLYQLNAKIEHGKFHAQGTYEENSDPFNALINASTQSKPTQYSVKYQGNIVGRTIVGKFTKTKIEPQTTSTLLGLLETTPTSFSIIISADGKSAGCLMNNKFLHFTLSK